MLGQVRAAHVDISLDGQSYGSQLAPYLITALYEDNCDGKKADDFNLELADRDGKFISTWMPKKGATFQASIIAERWFSPIGSQIKLDCGKFWIDSVEFLLPDHKVSIKGTSIPTDVRLKGSTETRGWDGTSLQDIANQIAGENNMTLDWQAGNNPRYTRTEMHAESSLSFLMKRCNDAKLAVKIKNGKIIVFDEQKMEEAAPSFTLLYGNTAVAMTGASYRLSGAHFVTMITDTTKGAKISHANLGDGWTSQGKFTAPEVEELPESTEDKENVDTDTESEDGGGDGEGGGGDTRTEELVSSFNKADEGADLKAKSHVRDKNKKKDQCRAELSIGNPLVAAGQTFMLVGCGQFDGKWFVETAHHKVAPEYTTELQIRKCLQGY
jgi:phage protein D